MSIRMTKTIEKIETGSTNSDAKTLADAGADHLTVVWAHRQTAGRGRHDRAWVSMEGNVFWSVILRPDHGWPNNLGQVVYVCALSVLKAIRAVVGDDAQLKLKWPNDVLLNGCKVSGTLLEAKVRGNGRPEYIVAGTGINVVAHPDGSDLRYPASDLRAQGFAHAQRDSIIARLRPSLESELERWLKHGFDPVRQDYHANAFGLNTVLRVGLTPNKSDYHEGVYEGIDANGSMMLRVGGEVMLLNSGDVLLPI